MKPPMPDHTNQPIVQQHTGVTRALARHIVAARPDQLPRAVRAEAVRTFLNWMGCAVGAAAA